MKINGKFKSLSTKYSSVLRKRSKFRQLVLMCALIFMIGGNYSVSADYLLCQNVNDEGSSSTTCNSLLNVTSAQLIDDSKTSLVSEFVYIPLVQKDYHVVRSLGVAQLLSGPNSCDDQECYQLDITCSQLSLSDQVTLKVGEPIETALKGTILFATGWTGTYYWDGSTFADADFTSPENSINLPPLAALSHNSDINEHLRKAGYRTVQVKWQNNWWYAQLGHIEGMGNLACRPATVAQWVYDNLHNPLLPYCAEGHSNGASQMGYALAQYDISKLFSAVVFESGPNWSRIDYACLNDSPNFIELYGDNGERNSIDWGFGFQNDGTGPCAQNDVNFRSTFQEASLDYGYWNFKYPKLMTAFVFGGADTSSTAAQGKYYYDLLVSKGSPFISTTTVPDAPHFVTETSEGAQVIEDLLLNECHLR